MAIRRVSCICIRGRQLLVARNQNKTSYYTPGGRVEPGEADADALSRELAEELSVTIAPDSLQPYKVFTGVADEKTGDSLFMASFFGKLEGNFKLRDGEIAEMRWITSADKALLSPMAQQLLAALQQDGLID